MRKKNIERVYNNLVGLLEDSYKLERHQLINGIQENVDLLEEELE